jgi:ADP-heptose:LPS heptosyltransferase
MKTALFVSRNLIGDALNIAPALRAWWAAHQSEYQIDLLTNPDPIAQLYTSMGVPLNVIFTEEEAGGRVYEFRFNFDVSKAFQIGIHQRIHIAEAYARMLGTEIDGVKPTCIPPSADSTVNEIEIGCILLSPFSVSCSSRQGKPPNKMLPFEKWGPVIRYLKTFNRKLYVLGSARDCVVAEFALPEEAFLLGKYSLPEVAKIMRDRASLIVSVDNGMAHLAASQELPTVLFYPACLPQHWIVPRGNPHCEPIQLDPSACDAALVERTVRDLAPGLLAIRC